MNVPCHVSMDVSKDIRPFDRHSEERRISGFALERFGQRSFVPQDDWNVNLLSLNNQFPKLGIR
ncbi:hypothetical protein BH23CHL1_BH23CHL1_21290 [soil metagenome]